MGIFDALRKGRTAPIATESTAGMVADLAPKPTSNDQVIRSGLVWSLTRPPISAVPETAVTLEPASLADADLVGRVQAAYRAAIGGFQGSTSFWDTTFNEISKPVHDALVSDKPATSVLRNPSTNSHFWGFDAICKAPEGEVEPHELVMRNMGSGNDWTSFYARWLHDAVVSLAEAVGACRIFYPETSPGHHYAVHGQFFNIDKLLDGIEKAIGKVIEFPNPFAGELGLVTSRGVAGFRSLQAVYQAWRLLQLANGRDDFRVIEIGAGLGRTAYFSKRFGIAQYTVIDIPLTNAAQSYFLGRTLGPENVNFYKEGVDTSVRILPPQSMRDLNETFDIMVNVDSFTEMSKDVQLSYWNFARSNTDALLSINHEFNSNTVRSLYESDRSVRVSRHPYWMRRGYVEEHLTWLGQKHQT